MWGFGLVLGVMGSANGCVTQARNYGGSQNEEGVASGVDTSSVGDPAATGGTRTGVVLPPGATSSGESSASTGTGTNGATDDSATGTETALSPATDDANDSVSEVLGDSHTSGSAAASASSTQPVHTTETPYASEAESSDPVIPPDLASSSPTSSGPTSSSSATSDTTPPIPAVDKYFVEWPTGKDPLTIGKRAAAIFTSKSLPSGSGHSNTDDYKHYKDACAWYGALSVALVAGEQLLIDSLVAKYEPYKGTWGEFQPPTQENDFVGTVDDSLFGIVPLAIAQHRSDAIYIQEGDSAADHQIAFIESQKRYTSDDMFMITALQVQAYRVITDANHRQRHLDTAADTMVEYLGEMQRNDGLIPHHLDREDYAIAWSRGNGWFAAGMAELIRELPSSHPDYAAISDGYAKMMNGLLQYQIPQGQAGAGLWKQVVDSSDSRNWVETSGSAMFTYALVSGVRAGWLDVETFGPAARNAWIGLVGQLNSNGEVQNISDWAYLPESHGLPANAYADDEENYYFTRGKLTGDGHGQSPLMWSAAELSRPLD